MSGVVNLCFHGIGTPGREREPGEDAYWIPADLFHRILDLVTDDPRVRLSFDDGNASDLELGLPALLDRGLDATFFVLAGRLDGPGSLDPGGVRQLVAAGMRIGTHGMDHVPWRGLDGGFVRRELVEARAVLEDVSGTDVREAALPLGRYDRRLLGHVRRLGYTRLHTSDRSWARGEAWLQPRFSIRRHDTVASVRSQMLTPAPWAHRSRAAAVSTVKRLR